MIAKRRSTPVPAVNRPPPATSPNLLLAALPADDYARLASSLQPVSPKLKEIVHKAGEPISHVYFPGGGFFSVLTVLEDGKMVEVATIGREGVLGVSAVMEAGPVPAVAMVQADLDSCYAMKAEVFRREMGKRGAFYDLITHYALALVGFVMQSTACNAVHSVEQRLARWLLMAQDRVAKDQFALTQEFAAMMLGVSRPTVTVVAGTLQRAGLITYRHGRVTIADREGLESASCECYRVATSLLQAVTSRARES